MNDASGFTVVINDAKAAKLKKLHEMFNHVLVDTFYSMSVNPEVIGCYLNELGNKVIYTKNADRKKTAQHNQRVQDLFFILEDISNDIKLSLIVNNSYYKLSDTDEAIKPKEKMLELFGKYGVPVIKHGSFDLHVRLLLGGENNDAVRCLRVPSNINFEYLHCILQEAFGWQNSHLYSFGMLTQWNITRYEKPEIRLISKNEDSEYISDEIYAEDKRLIDYMREYQKILYIYDYGDHWVHQIEVVNFNNDCMEELPILLSGEGNAPPEDVGGQDGFSEFLEIINNPKHEEYESMKIWAAGQNWHPFDFSMAARRVKNV